MSLAMQLIRPGSKNTRGEAARRGNSDTSGVDSGLGDDLTRDAWHMVGNEGL